MSPFYLDDGTEINSDSIAKPGICIICKNNDDPDQELLCILTRIDQQDEQEFICHAFK